MKKIICFILMILLLSALMVPAAFAEGNVVIALSNASAKPGETFDVKVSVSNNPGINTLTFGLDYDTNLLEVVSASALLTTGSLDALDANEVLYYECASGVSFSDNTDVVSVTFKVKDGVSGSTSVSLTQTSFDGVYSVTGARLGYTIQPATIIIDSTHTHSMVHHDAVVPSCTATGTKEYWQCSECGKMFSDEAGNNEITAPETIPMIIHDLTKVDEVPATCTEPGTEAYWKCTKCGKMFSIDDGRTEITAPKAITPGHKLTKVDEVAATCTEDGAEAYWKCSVCGKMFSDEKGENEITAPVVITKLGHDWGEWTVIKEATEEAEGERTRICKNDSSHVDTEPIPVLNHEHSMKHVEAVAATCDKEGNKEYWECTKCGRIFSDEAGENELNKEDVVIPALDHDWSEWTETKAATCEEAGEETRECSRCGKKETRELKALGHDWSEWTETKAATCEEAGEETRECSRCGDKETRELKALGHDWGEWTETKAATCEEAGEETRECSRCGDKETRELKALGHAWSDWTVLADDETKAQRVCANDKTHVEIKALDELDTKTAIDMNKEIAVTDALKGVGLGTVSDIESKLSTQVTAEVTKAVGEELAKEFKADSIEYYDVVLVLTDENLKPILDANGQEIVLTNENMPSSGIDIAFSFPAGVTADNYKDYKIVVVHMFGEGAQAGQTEVLTPTVSAGGITVHVNSLSPFAVAAVKLPETKQDSDADTSKKDVQKQDVKKASTPKTGDDSAIVLWTVLFLTCGASAVVVGKKKFYNR